MERPRRVKGRSSVTHVKAHGKSAWIKTAGLGLCLHPGFAPAQGCTIWVWLRWPLSQGAGRRVLREGEEPEVQEQVAFGSTLASTNLNLFSTVFFSLPPCSPQLSGVMASSKLREPTDEVFGKFCSAISLAKATWHWGVPLGTSVCVYVCVCAVTLQPDSLSLLSEWTCQLEQQ